MSHPPMQKLAKVLRQNGLIRFIEHYEALFPNNHLKDLIVDEIGPDRRIRVNAVSPGSTDTPGLNGLLASTGVGQARLKTISSNVPLGRLGTPDEIAKAVVFLASDDSSYITGTELFVDGGFAQV